MDNSKPAPSVLLNFDVPEQNRESENIVFLLDQNGKFLDVKYKNCELLLFPPDQFMGKYYYDILPEDIAAGLKAAINSVNCTGNFQTYNYELTLGGETKYFDTILIPQPGNNILSVVSNSTRTVTYQKLLIERKKNFKRILSNIRDLISETDIRGCLTFVSPSHTKILGYQKSEMLGRLTADFVHPDDLLKYKDQLAGLLHGTPFYGELRFRHKDGHYLNIEISSEVLKDKSGKVSGFVAVSRDITEAVRREEKIKSSLLEKEILLKEIHHRVKNNLQIICSLLSLQSDLLNNKNYIEAFNDSRNRIRSMAIIHEKLYQSNNFASIDFCEYAAELISFLRKSYASLFSNIKIEHDFDRIILGIDTAIPLGLILNELVSNAFKYAFSEDKPGVLICSIKKQNSHIIMTVKDNGPGIPGCVSFEKSETLGLMLVKSLSVQLKGTIEMHNMCGAEFIVKFPLTTPEAVKPAAGQALRF